MKSFNSGLRAEQWSAHYTAFSRGARDRASPTELARLWPRNLRVVRRSEWRLAVRAVEASVDNDPRSSEAVTAVPAS